jgi:transcriptional regulator
MPERRDFLLTLSALALADGSADAGTLYIPDRHAERDRTLLADFLDEYSFAMVLSVQGGLRVTNVPTLHHPDASGWGRLWWHLAKNNPQNQALDGESECTVVFHGPHAYISPNWYQSKNAVPTWNFATVHATGKPRRLDDDATAAGLKRLVDKNEARYGGGSQWSYSQLPESYLRGMRQGIVAYEMTIETVEAKFKLGHERSAADQQGVIDGLTKQRPTRDILELTRSYYQRKSKTTP